MQLQVYLPYKIITRTGMKFKLSKNLPYQLLFALCVAVTYLNSYELTFAVWLLTAGISIKQRYSLRIINYLLLFSAIIGIAFVAALFREYLKYNYIRDITYLLKPIIGLLVGYQLCRNYDIKPFHTIVYTGFFIALVHLGIIFYSIVAYRIINIHELRHYGGFFSDFEIYSLLVLLFSDRFRLGFSQKYKLTLLSILVLSSFLYLSRTNFLQFIILYMGMQGYFKINRRSLTIMGSFVLFVLLLYSVLFSMKFSRNGSGMEAFLFKVKNAPIEAFKTKVDKDDWQDFNDNYRSYETMVTRKQVGATALGPLFGKGLGSTIDLGREVWTNDGEFIRYIPTLHNGYSTVYLKAGIAGVLLYMWFLFYLCRIKKTNNDFIKQLNLFLLGTGIYLFLSSWVLLGLYLKIEMDSYHKKKRIFVDCHVFDGTFQGTTTYIKGVYTQLIKNENLDIYLAAQDTAHLITIFGTAPNVHYLKYSSKNKFYRLLFDIPGLIKLHKIDYAHFQYVVPPLKYCKYITTLHDVLFMEYPEYFPAKYRLKNKLMFKYSAKKSDLVLTVSDYSKQQIKKHFNLSNVIITPNAVDAEFFTPYNRQGAVSDVKARFNVEEYWLYVSRWEPRKNHHGLLKAFLEGQYYKEYYLVFVGDNAIPNPEYDAIYSALPQEIKERVIKLTKINFSDLLLLIRASSLSVYPSIAEGFGIPPLEAAAAGIPVACSNATAMGDFKFFNDTLFNPLSVNDMILKINKALNNPGAGVQQQIKERYNWQASAQNIVRALL
jgi:glycosyltransferase involved in cell wall biosynthesis